MFLRFAFVSIVFLSVTGCVTSSVTEADIAAVQPGHKITYRMRENGTRWYYIDKVTRVEDDAVFFNPSIHRSSSASDGRLYEFNTTRELSISKADLAKYLSETGPQGKKIVRIE